MQLPTFYYRCQNDSDWSMSFISGKCEEVLECSAAVLMSNRLSIGKMILPQEDKFIRYYVENALIKKAPYQLIYHVITAKHNEKILFEQGLGIYNENGELTELTGFISDFTLYSKENTNIYSVPSINNCIKEVTKLAKSLKLTTNKFPIITEKETEIAIYFCQGLSMKEIGLKLDISNRTVESHLYRIKAKLGCYTKLQLRNLFLKTESGRNLIMLKYLTL
ncbi:MAG: helix-turn-helix transcriptional regulator [Gammaproteobacteria bacterium]